MSDEPTPLSEVRQQAAESGHGARVLLSLPVEPDWLSLARTTCAGVAARADFSYDEIADLRLAIDELCLSLLEQSSSGEVMQVAYRLVDDAIVVEASVSGTGGISKLSPDASSEFSKRILDALVDEHGRDPSGRTAWFQKVRGSTGP